ncbi:MAG: hypothetical protein V1766_02305 [Pseudomonadota bacterium]
MDIHDKTYRHLFLVQNRMYWRSCPFPYEQDRDLVLTYDYGVFREIRTLGGEVAFLDHLIDPEVMEKYNFETYDFFAKWHRDQKGDDIFAHRGIEVGNAFRIAIWSNMTSYVRTLVNLLSVKKIKCEKRFVGINDGYAIDIINKLGIEIESWAPQGDQPVQEYYFPILRWIDENIYPAGLKQAFKVLLARILDLIFFLVDNLILFRKSFTNVYIHSYHPTKRIIEQFKKDPGIRLIFDDYTRDVGSFRERRVPVWRTSPRYRRLAAEMIDGFQVRKSVHWEIDGFPVSQHLYPIIVQRISERLVDCLKTLDSLSGYFKKKKLKLMVAISNIGFTNCLMLNYCHHHQIPTYLIINGLLTNSYLDEAKDAAWINAYGESVKTHYFRGMNNIVCLGDPRMDDYGQNVPLKSIDPGKPTIVIGASGFNNIDLNSYVVVEFDFLHDLLTACNRLKEKGREMRLVLKIRPNGYLEQYEAFLKEYFPDVTVELYDRIPMKEVLSRADFYITFYSQTLFEASCLGIPVLYYKKDTEISHPPFDGKSELVTASSVDDLVEKMELFYQNDRIYGAFKHRAVMERYIGPLDGHNLQRNMDFIYSLLSETPGASRVPS